MDQKIEDKITLIKAALQTAGLKVAQKKRILRTRLNNGSLVDIFTLKNSPDQIRARIKIEEPDPLRRQAYVESVFNGLSAILNGSVSVDPFYLSREIGGAHIYLSVLELKEALDDDEPIEIDEDAIEIIDEEELEAEMEPVCSSEFAVDEKSEDLAEFSLDFDLESENRIRVVKSMAEEALENLESVDPKMLRQSLDMIHLKRSSAVRLAITRIFRSALELAELEKTIQNEAKRILSAEDRAELREVKSLCGNGFLEPVINLLWQEVFK